MSLRPLRPYDPRVLGVYTLLGVIGEGGMGAVYQARDPGGRIVAIKVIRPEYAESPEFRARFRSEVQRASQVPPFSTAAVLDADPEHHTPYLVVEYVDGPDLTQVVDAHGPLTDGALHSVAVGVATALAAIHGAGVVHRDLKPANVLFALGSPKVIDFGIARALEATSKHTRTGQMVGTVAYMAPERLDGPATEQADPAVDVFAWGAVITYAGTGHVPFPGDSPTGMAIRILTGEPDLRGLTGTLRTAVERSLTKNPADRPTAGELLDILLSSDSAERTRLVQAAPAPTGPRAVGSHRASRPDHRVRTAAVAGAVLTLILATAAIVMPWSKATTGATPALSSSAAPTPTMVITDMLIAPSLWAETKNGPASCTFTGDFLVIAGTNGVMCRGPRTEFTGDQRVFINVESVVGDVCGRVYFRYHHTGEGSYVLEICATRADLVSTTDAERWKILSRVEIPDLGAETRRFGITVEDDFATVSMGSAEILTAPLVEPGLTGGTVELASGVYGRTPGSQVVLYGIEVWQD
ncbi:serine/threonine protein kinase [Actinoplanes derwentensis]|uniref:Serine/threonine protein kinase n=1 Tax=Actinoplanes derwentensis TaxID=113562 RepID=A0A1H1SI52_9ACTN|nr:serine/threonine-protein kinase [Actinoplanes derwentensis]GID83300.1 hypothetical protein Ade03nite_22240 [Actinoplanes derwentensis]SDS47498.1 Serine/threonine protein kinase [Actinoplanes derwentensis]